MAVSAADGRWSGIRRTSGRAGRPPLTHGTGADPLSRLTPRGRTVLEAPAQGCTNAAIARKLHISPSAVENNLNTVFDKPGPAHRTGCNRRIPAVLRHLEA
ncbi:response regulator transcription factor [Streptomyces sp. NPDC087901]|uniref:response regulator transcription factor n=1 Tax=Streptomyces sp. NPDC087901 TaxID=3365818 RepID=UPI00380E10D5